MRIQSTHYKSALTHVLSATLLAIMIMLSCVGFAKADDVILGEFLLPEVSVRGVSEGMVRYKVGRVTNERAIERIVFYLTDVPDLQIGEVAFAQNNIQEALDAWAEALNETDKPWQRAWIHYRRTIAFDNTGRFVEAVGEWAQLIVLQPDSYWSMTAPVAAHDFPSVKTTVASLELIRDAQTQIANPILKSAAANYEEDIEDILHKAMDAERDSNNATDENITGINNDHKSDTEMTNPDSTHIKNEPQPGKTLQNDTNAPDMSKAAENYDTPQTGGVGEQIDQAIANENYIIARKQIELLAANPRNYPIDRLLYQYGIVLRNLEQPQDAAIRLMQCAILFPDSRYALPSMLEVAHIYRDEFDDATTAIRLLQAVIDREAEYRQQIIVKNKAKNTQQKTHQDPVRAKIAKYAKIELEQLQEVQRLQSDQ